MKPRIAQGDPEQSRATQGNPGQTRACEEIFQRYSEASGSPGISGNQGSPGNLGALGDLWKIPRQLPGIFQRTPRDTQSFSRKPRFWAKTWAPLVTWVIWATWAY